MAAASLTTMTHLLSPVIHQISLHGTRHVWWAAGFFSYRLAFIVMYNLIAHDASQYYVGPICFQTSFCIFGIWFVYSELLVVKEQAATTSLTTMTHVQCKQTIHVIKKLKVKQCGGTPSPYQVLRVWYGF